MPRPLTRPASGAKPPAPLPAPDDLTVLAADYIAHIKHERGLSTLTCLHYQSWLRLFLKWLETEGHPLTLASFITPVLRAYLYASSQAGKRPRTILSSFNPIRGLAVYLMEVGVIPYDPTKALTFPKKDAAERITVSQEEIRALIAAVERMPDMEEIPLAKGLLYTLVFSGIRFDELRSLKVKDISIDAGTLLVAHGKGEKSRLLYPTPECMDVLAVWLTERRKRFPQCQHDYLWVYNDMLRVSEMYIRDTLEAIKAIAGLRDHDNIKPHALRHAFATRMKDNGAPITAIKAALGHSELATTFQYLHMGEYEARQMATYGGLYGPGRPVVAPEPPRTAPQTAVYGMSVKEARVARLKRLRTPSK